MTDRRKGATTRQMMKAARGAIFVWCDSSLYYPKALARHLCREDLRIVSPGQICASLFDGPIAGVVVDHAADLTNLQWEHVHTAQRRVALAG